MAAPRAHPNLKAAIAALEPLGDDKYFVALGPNGKHFCATPDGYSLSLQTNAPYHLPAQVVNDLMDGGIKKVLMASFGKREKIFFLTYETEAVGWSSSEGKKPGDRVIIHRFGNTIPKELKDFIIKTYSTSEELSASLRVQLGPNGAYLAWTDDSSRLLSHAIPPDLRLLLVDDTNSTDSDGSESGAAIPHGAIENVAWHSDGDFYVKWRDGYCNWKFNTVELQQAWDNLWGGREPSSDDLSSLAYVAIDPHSHSFAFFKKARPGEGADFILRFEPNGVVSRLNGRLSVAPGAAVGGTHTGGGSHTNAPTAQGVPFAQGAADGGHHTNSSIQGVPFVGGAAGLHTGGGCHTNGSSAQRLPFAEKVNFNDNLPAINKLRLAEEHSFAEKQVNTKKNPFAEKVNFNDKLPVIEKDPFAVKHPFAKKYANTEKFPAIDDEHSFAVKYPFAEENANTEKFPVIGKHPFVFAMQLPAIDKHPTNEEYPFAEKLPSIDKAPSIGSLPHERSEIVNVPKNAEEPRVVKWARSKTTGRTHGTDTWELDLKRGELLMTLKDMGNGWFFVQNQQGQKGWAHESVLDFNGNRKEAYERFQADMKQLRVAGNIRHFPKLSSYMNACEKDACKPLKQDVHGIGICIHDLHELLRGSGVYDLNLLKTQRNNWHPDQFAKSCKKQHHEELRRKSEIVFVMFGTLMDKLVHNPRAEPAPNASG